MTRARIFIVRVRREGVTTERAVIAHSSMDAKLAVMDEFIQAYPDEMLDRIEAFPA